MPDTDEVEPKSPKPVENAKEQLFKLIFGMPAVFAILVPTALAWLVSKTFAAGPIAAAFIAFVSSYIALPLIVLVLRIGRLSWREIVGYSCAFTTAIIGCAGADVALSVGSTGNPWRMVAWLAAVAVTIALAWHAARRMNWLIDSRPKTEDRTDPESVPVDERFYRPVVFGGIAAIGIVGALLSLLPVSTTLSTGRPGPRAARFELGQPAVRSLKLQDALRRAVRSMHGLHDRQAVALIQDRLEDNASPTCAPTRGDLRELTAAAYEIEKYSRWGGNETVAGASAAAFSDRLATVLARFGDGVEQAGSPTQAAEDSARKAAVADCKSKRSLYYDALQVADWRASLAYSAFADTTRGATKALFVAYQQLGTIVFVASLLVAAAGLAISRSSNGRRLHVARAECILALAVCGLFASPWVHEIDEQSLDIKDPSSLFTAQAWYAPHAIAAALSPNDVALPDPFDPGDHPPPSVSPDSISLGIALDSIRIRLDALTGRSIALQKTIDSIGIVANTINYRVR